MDLTKFYDQITNSALFGGSLLLIALALWYIAFSLQKRHKKNA
jgi:hypothetical protein